MPIGVAAEWPLEVHLMIEHPNNSIHLLRIVKSVLVMSVNPGNAGQMYLP